MKIDWIRIVFFIIAAALSVLAGMYGQPLIHGNADAIAVIVSVYSILAGFLVTVMTLLGEPGLFRGRTWRSEAVKRSNVYRRLVRHKWLFILYLLVLGLIFVSSLITNKTPDSDVVTWIERIYMALASLAFMLSLALPQRLMNIQLSRFDEMVNERKNGK
jgi:hypothetical protein